VVSADNSLKRYNGLKRKVTRKNVRKARVRRTRIKRIRQRKLAFLGHVRRRHGSRELGDDWKDKEKSNGRLRLKYVGSL